MKRLADNRVTSPSSFMTAFIGLLSRAGMCLVCLALVLAFGSFEAFGEDPKPLDTTQIKKDEKSLLGEISKWETGIEETQKEIDAVKTRLAALNTQYETAEKELKKRQNSMAQQKKQAQKRLRAAYRMAQMSHTEFLASSSGISDFALRKAQLSRLINYDRKVFVDYLDAMSGAAKARETLEKARQEAGERTAELDQRIAQQKSNAKQLKSMLDKIRRDKALARQLQRERLQAQRQLAQKVVGFQNQPTKGSSLASRKGRLPCPVQGSVIEKFGEEETDFGKVFHRGIRIKAGKGRPVRAIFGGTVRFAGRFKGFGNMIILDHGKGYHTLYAHLQGIGQPQGVTVEAGDIVGYVGSSGGQEQSALYLEIRKHGRPQDPERWTQCR